MSLVRVESRGTIDPELYPSADHPAARPIASEHAALPFALRLLRIVFDRDVVDFADYVDHDDAPELIGLVDEEPDDAGQKFEDLRHLHAPEGLGCDIGTNSVQRVAAHRALATRNRHMWAHTSPGQVRTNSRLSKLLARWFAKYI